MDSLYQIVYTSVATAPFSRDELIELLKGSVRRNTRAGITGLLLYQSGAFIQALEGEKEALMDLFEKISRDPRHHHIIRLIQGPIKERYYPNSAMAFRDLDSPELRRLPGYSEFLNTPLNGELLAKNIPACKRLLLLFKQNIR
ncbi:MAG TPA: BLUF domain-containing protein [Candidatus Sulfopaludibacter sp.]|nr:BLUF domain-containing protein [Candidatus Sulfopaludibacter sp.]